MKIKVSKSPAMRSIQESPLVWNISQVSRPHSSNPNSPHSSNILNKIHEDHMYIQAGNSPNVTKKVHLRSGSKKTPSDETILEELTYALWSSPHVSVKSEPTQEEPGPSSAEKDDHDDMLSLDADSIQKVFQNMISMTSLAPITDSFAESGNNTEDNRTDMSQNLTECGTSASKLEPYKVVLSNKYRDSPYISSSTHFEANDVTNLIDIRVDEKQVGDDDPKESGASNDQTPAVVKLKKKTKPKKKKRKRRLDDILSAIGAREVESDETSGNEWTSVDSLTWKEINRLAENEREMNILLKHTADLLVRRWGEYVTMTTDDIRKFEIQNAKEVGMIDEVIEMLEDKNRYVWELIDDLNFF